MDLRARAADVRGRVAPGTRPALGSHAQGVLLVLGAAVSFGMLGPLSNFAYQAGMTPAAFTALRATLGAGVLAVYVHGFGAPVRLRSVPRRQRAALGAAVVANALLNLCLFAAYGEMVVALVLAIYFSYPILVACASVALGRERFTPARVAGLGLATAGLALVLGSQVGPSAGLTVLGLVFAAATAVCQATYLVVSRAGYPVIPSDQATGIILTGGALLAGPIALGAGDASTLVAWIGDPRAWLAVLVAGTLGAALAKVWLLRGVRAIGGTRTAVVMLAEPLTGVILAALFLGQPLTLPEIAGGALILAAALLVQRPSRPVDARPIAPAPFG